MRESKQPKGRYVYGWFDGSVPFYIGKGVGLRAWSPHTDHNGQSMPCERRKMESMNFSVVIFKDSLTNEGALLVESVLIETFTRFGVMLTNITSGLIRREKPPLTLESLLEELNLIKEELEEIQDEEDWGENKEELEETQDEKDILPAEQEEYEKQVLSVSKSINKLSSQITELEEDEEFVLKTESVKKDDRKELPKTNPCWGKETVQEEPILKPIKRRAHKDANPTLKNIKYNWKVILSGSIVVLSRGVDYDNKSETFGMQIRLAARRRALQVKVSVRKDEVVVQAIR